MKTREEWRAHLEALPEPMAGSSPWKRIGVKGEDTYQLVSELTAKAMLIVADEDPTLLDIPDSITDSYGQASYDAAWLAAEARWPGLDDWLGGITGNVFGWANQVVRYIHDKPPVGNPAIVTIERMAPGTLNPTR